MSLKPIKSSRNHKRDAAWRSFRTRQQFKPWHGWNSNPRKIASSILGLFGKKLFVLLFVCLMITGIFGVMYLDPNNPAFHGYKQYGGQDPVTTIYRFNDVGNTGQFNSIGATYVADDGLHSGASIRLATPGGGQTPVMISNSSVDVSLGSSKELDFAMSWTGFGGSCCKSIRFGFFLTTNNTVPQWVGYNPLFDKNVALLVTYQNTSNVGCANLCQYSITTYINKELGKNTIASADSGGCGQTSCYLFASATLSPQTTIETSQLNLNYTGSATVTGSGIPACNNSLSFQFLGSISGTGSNCSSLTHQDRGAAQLVESIQVTPSFQFTGKYYVGYYAMPGTNSPIDWFFDNSCIGSGAANAAICNESLIFVPVNTNTQPPPANFDTGGFFGPIIKALIVIGVFMLQQIFNFFSFLASVLGPILASVFTVLENFIVTALNAIGNFLGWGNLGTDLQTLLNALITFLTDPTNGLPFWILQVPAYMSRFFSWITLGATWVPAALTLAQNAINVALAGFSQAITILSVGLQFFAASSAFLMIFAYFLYVGDDAITGVLDWAGTIERLMFSLINIIFDVVNVSLDFIGMIVSVIPKPFIQSTFNRIPRLPSLSVGGSGIAWPRLDFAEALSGNLITYFFWIIGFYMSAWYESRNPCLVGSLCALVPATASNMQLLANLLPVIQVFVFFSGGLCLFWLVNRPLIVIGLPEVLEEAGLGVGPGRQARSGPAGVGFKAGVKHFGPKAFGVQARLEKAGARPVRESEENKSPEEQATA